MTRAQSIRFMSHSLHKILRAAAMVLLVWHGFIVRAAAQPAHDHTPRHGGLLLPVVHDTLHIEAVWPMQRIVHVFVYDEAMRAIAPDRLPGIRGRIGVGGETFALRPSGDGFLEARIPSSAIPARMTLELALTAGDEQPFDLVFPGYSVESQAFDFVLPPTPIPDSLAGLLAALRDDARDAHASLGGNGLIFAYAPAVRARDHLLALDAHVARLAPPARPRAEAAVLAAVRAAWLLHVAADAGISPWQIGGSVGVLTEALDEVVDAFGGTSR
jgi:hypothetical protein